ncbi:MAG: response regulator [Planctomycetota bacterium]
MASPKQANILVVDDEPDVLELLADALSEEGHSIVTTSNGNHAIELARAGRPDLIVTDLALGDCSGLDVLDALSRDDSAPPAIVITGQGDPEMFSQASRRRPVELLTKPLDLDRLAGAVQQELNRLNEIQHIQRRNQRLRHLVRRTSQMRRVPRQSTSQTCADLTTAYRSLSRQMAMQGIVLGYQKSLLGARCDDDVFATLFRMFVQRTGPVFGVAMVCDSAAQLRIVGRFGVPHPDSLAFCQKLTDPMVDILLANPHPTLIDAQEREEMFDASIRRYLVGVTVLAVPLIPAPGEMIGMSVFYRKGEQPFVGSDVALAEMVSHPTAVAIRRND